MIIILISHTQHVLYLENTTCIWKRLLSPAASLLCICQGFQCWQFLHPSNSVRTSPDNHDYDHPLPAEAATEVDCMFCFVWSWDVNSTSGWLAINSRYHRTRGTRVIELASTPQAQQSTGDWCCLGRSILEPANLWQLGWWGRACSHTLRQIPHQHNKKIIFWIYIYFQLFTCVPCIMKLNSGFSLLKEIIIFNLAIVRNQVSSQLLQAGHVTQVIYEPAQANSNVMTLATVFICYC